MNIYVRDEVVEKLNDMQLRKKLFGIEDEKILQKIPISDVIAKLIEEMRNE